MTEMTSFDLHHTKTPATSNGRGNVADKVFARKDENHNDVCAVTSPGLTTTSRMVLRRTLSDGGQGLFHTRGSGENEPSSPGARFKGFNYTDFYRQCIAHNLRKVPEFDKIEIQDARPQSTDPLPEWSRGVDSGDGGRVAEEEFNEDAFLSGRIPVLRQSVERELPPRDPSRKKKFRERASWEKPADGEEAGDGNGDFNENDFLSGRGSRTSLRGSVDRELPPSGANSGQFDRIPSKAFRYLRRSVSREGPDSSPPPRRSMSAMGGYSCDSASEDEMGDPDKAYNSMVYVGKKIPSKTFARLNRSMNRKAKNLPPTRDEFERLRQGLDVDKTVNNASIQNNDPEKYLEQMKASVENNETKPGGEVTDF